MGPRAIRVTDIGGKARRLVAGASTPPTLFARLSRSLYLDVAGEIVWLGPPGSTLHARAMLADTPMPDAGAHGVPYLDVSAARAWRPPALPSRVTADAMARGAGDIARAVPAIGRPEGFGVLLTGKRPPFPLGGAAAAAGAFMAACAAGEAPAAAVIADRLLGLGPGLTPAGDDLIGGAFFARRALAEAGAIDGMPWRAAGEAIRARAVERTHRISAALLGDLLDGDGYAPLHDLVVALASGHLPAALDAAARLIRLGHSSGWDLLAGCLGALGASPGR